MIMKIPHDNCTGCGICRVLCPKHCITMVENKEGFKYPIIDEEVCIQCGKCVQVCTLNNLKEHKETTRAYAMQALDSQLLESSSSGGVFSLLAEEIFNEKGVVVGAAFDENFEVSHVCIDSVEDLHRLRGSKYVQSDINTVYEPIKRALLAGKKVMFTGTPCQVDAINQYIRVTGVSSENLVLVDILCHGVPSRKVWRKYLAYRKNEDYATPIAINFRSKEISWKTYCMNFKYEDGSEYSNSNVDDLFLRGFLRNLYLRESCYSCNYKSLERVSDITIGDFWEVKKFSENFDMRGTSLVFTHTKKGEKILETTFDRARVEKIKNAHAVPNGGLYHSAFKNLDRTHFFRNLDCMDFPLLHNKYFGNRVLTKVKRVIARKIAEK